MCFLEKAIEFGAIDGKPVSVLFTMVSPTVRAHLHMLSRLTFALRNEWVKNLILSQAGRDEIFAAFEKIDQSSSANTKQQ